MSRAGATPNSNHARRRFQLHQRLVRRAGALPQISSLQSDLITPGSRTSRIFATMEFGGPMLKVFTAGEGAILDEYIDSLPEAPLGHALEAGPAMRVLFGSSAPLDGRSRARHFVLAGTYPGSRDGHRESVNKPVSWWFGIGQPERLMAALADPRNGWIVPGDAADSRFVGEYSSSAPDGPLPHPDRARDRRQDSPRGHHRVDRRRLPGPGDRDPHGPNELAVTHAPTSARTLPMPVADHEDPHAGVIQARTLNADDFHQRSTQAPSPLCMAQEAARAIEPPFMIPLVRPGSPPRRASKGLRSARAEVVDIAIAGAGPAGTAAALTLSRAGVRVRDGLNVRATLDLIRVGEGLPPGARPILESLGIWDRFRRAGHLPSNGNRSAWEAAAAAHRLHLQPVWSRLAPHRPAF